MMICFSTPDPFSSHAGSDFNAMETEKALGDDPSGVNQALAIFSRSYDFKNRLRIYCALQVSNPFRPVTMSNRFEAVLLPIPQENL